jgi:Putative prokaryotic signal transducing protein
MHKKHGWSEDTSTKADDQAVPVPVAVVTSRIEAELIVGMLRNNGLKAAVSPDHSGGRSPELQLQGVRVFVAAGDEAQARQLLAEADAEDKGPSS